ncbi:MAG: hypothetical protein HQ556_16375 [Candidatus Marinimicrobia bacterium]|nr:hypothetical protein [Candidatus Neomarinimicrobiota bacterium]
MRPDETTRGSQNKPTVEEHDRAPKTGILAAAFRGPATTTRDTAGPSAVCGPSKGCPGLARSCRAAKKLGIGERTLYRKLNQYDLKA